MTRRPENPANESPNVARPPEPATASRGPPLRTRGTAGRVLLILLATLAALLAAAALVWLFLAA